ncbi:MAG: hypothetical protein GF398_03575 [Chitinivibrionales bacterium]|nr:hypothetical protein [Chitinivibrionales bacterium]
MTDNFEDNRKAIMKQLSQIKRDKAMQKKARGTRSPAPEVSESRTTPLEKQKVIVYGKQSHFMRNFLYGIRGIFEETWFDDSEKAVNHCLDNTITSIILDMDEPTDWKMATDVFTNVKTINPAARIVLCTRDKAALPVETLAAQGGLIFEKPVDLEMLRELLS